MAAKQKIALVIGHVPTIEEIDQFRLIAEAYDFNVVCSESISGFLTQTSYFQDLTCVTVPDHDENPTFLPGLEKVLGDYDIVVVKERLGLYAYQSVKAKWQHRFRLVVWVDNMVAFPGQDIDQMRTVRQEITNAADAFIVQTKGAREALLAEGVEEKRIIDMLPWVEKRIDRNKKARAEALKALGLAEGSLLIAHMGQVEWEEGLADLVSALKIAATNDASLRRRLRVVFCGVGSYGADLRNAFVTHGIEDMAVYTAPNRRTVDAIMHAADGLFFSSIPSRDRIEGDIFRLLVPMTQEIPVIASRSPIVEETCGKHRIDFCQGSPASLAQAIEKLAESAALVHDTVKKNAADVAKRFSAEKVKASMLKMIDGAKKLEAVTDFSDLSVRMQDVENRIRNKQYLDAVDVIEGIFQLPNIPVHHRANLYRLVGDCFAKLGDFDYAKDAYVQAADLDPYSAKVYIGLGTLGVIRNSFDVAVLHFQRAFTLSPEDEMANLGLGLAFQGMKEYKEATRWVIKALEINPENAAALFTLVQLVYQTEQFKSAEKYLRQYIERKPEDSNMKFTLGGVLYRQGRLDEVSEMMNEILANDPQNERALALLKQVSEGNQNAEASSSNR